MLEEKSISSFSHLCGDFLSSKYATFGILFWGKQFIAIMNLIAKFKIPEHSTGIVFYTTRSNTGVNKGAVTRVVQGIDKYLLQLVFSLKLKQELTQINFSRIQPSPRKSSMFGRFYRCSLNVHFLV